MRRWYKIALLNLVVLTFLGLILRYKINFALPFFEQKKLLHSHSHFAFNGWVSFVLQLLILEHFTKHYAVAQKWWNRFFAITTIVNYAMLVAFAGKGYASISIFLSTIALLLSYIFTYQVYKNLPSADQRLVSTKFIRASLFFLVLSSLGPYALAIIMATSNSDSYSYHNAIYFFLHFQYNGWFIFVVLAFLVKRLEKSVNFNASHGNNFFIILFITCIPSYFLTTLWHQQPAVVTIINIATVLVQAASLIYFFKLLRKDSSPLNKNNNTFVRLIYIVSITAFVLKIILQCFSAHPTIGQLTFAFRPIVIGYLHLVFLVFVSLFILALLVDQGIIPLGSAVAKWGLGIFSATVVLNEVLLAVQGVAAIFYTYLPLTHIMLFINTIIIFLGATLIYISSIKNLDAPKIKPPVLAAMD